MPRFWNCVDRAVQSPEQSSRNTTELSGHFSDAQPSQNKRAASVDGTSTPSTRRAAASRPAPFFELQNLDESRFSVGDTLRLRAYITPAEHDIAGVSLFMLSLIHI